MYITIIKSMKTFNTFFCDWLNIYVVIIITITLSHPYYPIYDPYYEIRKKDDKKGGDLEFK